MARKGKEKVEPYVKLDNSMTESAAWTSLSDMAVWVYIELKKSFNFDKGGNNHLTLPYSRVKWRMSKDSRRKAIQELINRGFIRIVQPGGLLGNPDIFALSNEWESISRKIVDKAGREAIRSGSAPKLRKREYKGGLKKLNEKRQRTSNK